MARAILRSIGCTALLVAATQGRAQNLVPNPSFEDHAQCPSDIGGGDFATGWVGITGSPDYFNECSTSDTVDIPANALGYQLAHQGSGYVGLVNYASGPQYREVLQAELLTPLVPGQLTYLSMAVSPGGFTPTAIDCCSPTLTSKGVGIRFSVAERPTGLFISNDAIIHLEEVLEDTSIWTIVSGSFVSDSAYRFIQIGNFFDDVLTDPISFDLDGDTECAYTYVDAVCVSLVAGSCDVQNAINEGSQAGHRLVRSFFDGVLTLDLTTLPESPYIISLMDVTGRSIAARPVRGGEGLWTWVTPVNVPGPYVLAVMGVNGYHSAEPIFRSPL